MFGKNKEVLRQMEETLEKLHRQNAELKKGLEESLQVIRQQLLTLASGLPLSPKSILTGLPYSEIPKEGVLDFIASVPNLLILDVRSDEGWNNGYIPKAKHVPSGQVLQRLDELKDKMRPILVVCANGNTALTVCQTLAREGYKLVFNALGGMAGYSGELVRPEVQASDITQVQGTDRELITKVLNVLDRDVRPGLKRDGGDIKVLAVEGGVVKVKMEGACVGCGAQKRTVEDGIKNHLQKVLPEIQDIEDHSLGIPQ